MVGLYLFYLLMSVALLLGITAMVLCMAIDVACIDEDDDRPEPRLAAFARQDIDDLEGATTITAA